MKGRIPQTSVCLPDTLLVNGLVADVVQVLMILRGEDVGMSSTNPNCLVTLSV